MTARSVGRPSELPPAAAGRRLLGLVVALVALGTAAVQAGPDVATVQGWATGSGWTVPVAITLLYAALVVALVPATVLTLAAGLLFGGLLGAVVTVIGATSGAVVAFALTRAGGRRAVERLATGRLAHVDDWLGARFTEPGDPLFLAAAAALLLLSVGGSIALRR